MQLGTLLLRDGVITLDDLEAALRSQILYGGRLGTNLVEGGALDMDTLGEYLAAAFGTPLAPASRFASPDPAALEIVPADLAEALAVFPLGFDDPDHRVLALALADPRDLEAVEALAGSTGLAIARYVAPELRIRYHIERHFGVPRDARYVRAGTTASAPRHRGERRRMQPPRGLELPPALRLDPRLRVDQGGRREGSGQPPGEVVGAPAQAAAAADLPSSAEMPAPLGEPTKRHASARPAPLPIDAVVSALEVASTREEVGDAIEEFARGRAEVVAAFSVRDGNALGWRCARYDGTPTSISQLSLPLGGSSALQSAHDAGRTFQGAPPAPGRPVEQRLWDALAIAEPPGEVVVVPVLVGERVVNLIYAHAHAGGDLGKVADELAVLSERIAAAFVRLIRAAKAGRAQPSA